MLSSFDLRLRDVINVLDGKRLGTINDLEIDLEAGRVTAIVVPGGSRFLGFLGRDKDYVIPWEKIIKIGVDVILVEHEAFSGAGYGDRERDRRRNGGRLTRGPWPLNPPCAAPADL